MSTVAIPLSNTTTCTLDRSLLYASSVLATPFCKAYELLRYRLIAPLDAEKFNNLPLIQEIAFRALIAVGAVATLSLLVHFPITFIATVLTLALGLKILRAIGFALQENGYTHVRTEAPEVPLGDRTTIAMQNFCGIEGGMHYSLGGVVPWQDRIDRFVERLRERRPHVIILQEIYTTSLAEALIEKLGDIYPHFFTHLGANVMGSVGGLMMITDHPIDSFSNVSFDNNDWTLNRTFAMMEIGNLRILGTHLIHGDERQPRKEQFEQILHYLADQEREMVTILGADFNAERDVEGVELLDPYLEHGYRGKDPTRTARLTQQWDGVEEREECIDNISQVKAVALPDGRRLPVVEEFRIEGVDILPAYDNIYNTKTALSDHHGMIATVRI